MSASHVSLGLCPSISVVTCGILVLSSRVNSGLFPPSAVLSGLVTEIVRQHSYHSALVAFVCCAFRVCLAQSIDESADFTHPFSAFPKLAVASNLLKSSPELLRRR